MSRRGDRDPGGSSRPLRLVGYSEADHVAGAEAVLQTIVAGAHESIAVTVMGPDAAVVSEIAGANPTACAVQTTRVTGRRDLAGLWALRRQLEREHPDVVHINLTDMAACLAATLMALSLRGVAVVVVEHHPWPPQSRWQRMAKMITVRSATAHVAVSHSLAEAVGAVVRRDPGRTRVIPNGVPLTTGVERPPLDGRPLELGMACRLHHDKGVDVVLRALADPTLADRAVRLRIAGDGPERRRLEDLAQQLGIGEQVRFLGWVPDPSVVYDNVDVFVLGSRSEALPLSVLEAMHANRAVLATDVGGVTEAVQHGVTGMVVAPDNPAALAAAVVALASDESTVRAMGDAGRQRARQEFAVAVMVERYLDLYESVLQPKR